MHRGNFNPSKPTTMRPLHRNDDGSVPSHQRKRASVLKSSFDYAASPQQHQPTPRVSGAVGGGVAHNTQNTATPSQTFMLYSGPSSDDECLSPNKQLKDEHLQTVLASGYALNRRSGSSGAASLSDSGSASSSSDCGKDLVKRKRYTTIKANKCEQDVLTPADALAGRRRAVVGTTDSASVGSSSLTLVKNSASLIFTKKVVASAIGSQAAVVHRKHRDTRSGGGGGGGSRRSENRSSLQGIGEHEAAVGVETVLRKERTHSWYAPLYAPLDEEADQDSTSAEPSPRLRNLAFLQYPGNEPSRSESTALLNPPAHDQHQAQIHQAAPMRPSGVTPPNSLNLRVTYQQVAGGPPDMSTYPGGPTTSQPPLPPPPPPSQQATPPKYSRFEQLIKSLVGRKVSRDVLSANGNANLPASPSKPPLTPTGTFLQSPEILITRTPSERMLIKNDRNSSSTASLNAVVQQKLWSVVPLLRKEGSCASLNQIRQSGSAGESSMDAGSAYSAGLKKCETVLALTRSSTNLEHPIRAQNRLRDSSSTITCSRCSSLLSLAANGSRYSLNLSNGGGFVSVGGSNSAGTSKSTPLAGQSSKTLLTPSTGTAPTLVFTCKLCLIDVASDQLCVIGQCGCTFCTECMMAYVEFEILEGAYEISCPDALCPVQGALTIEEITQLSSASLVDKHNRYRLNREVELDKTRTWCPRAGCDTVCLVAVGSPERVVTLQPVPCAMAMQSPCSVHCPTCREDFCSGCKKTWHPSVTCEENNRRLAADGQTDNIGIPFDNDLIKCCPTCSVPIEKDEGCAQMMCKRCKHVFCWYCLASLDDDFLLRHYDRGPCKNKLGHSRASVVWHRAQVIGIFAGFGILLLVASPLLLLAAPCIVCCKCRICSGAAKLEENEADFEEIVALQR